jgi:FtsP/CotA-like multicopper oxidase with cupredoxin domain
MRHAPRSPANPAGNCPAAGEESRHLLTRRQLLRLAGVGAAGMVAGAAGLVGCRPSRSAPGGGAGAELIEPKVLASSGGLLEVGLRAALGPVRLADRSARTASYNGAVPGPTLQLRPGDRLRLQLANDLDEPTNLHFHGLHVPPEGRADNVFLSIEPGQRFDYDLTIPSDHPGGTFWYHPHHHGLVAGQVFAGCTG